MIFFCKYYCAFERRSNVLFVMKYICLRYYLDKLYVWMEPCLQLPQSSVMILALRKKCGHCKVTYTTCEFSVHPAHNYHKSFNIPEPWCVWFWPVMITSFNIIVSTLYDQFRQIGMRPHGRQIGFCHSLLCGSISAHSSSFFH